MKVGFFRLCFGVLLLGAWGCEAYWSPTGAKCDATALQETGRWKSLAGGARGCLRLSWEGGASSQPALLTKSGQLVDPETAGIIELEIPEASRGKTLAFVFFAFGSGLPQAQQKDHCARQMGRADYSCARDDGGSCWFAIRFQPQPGVAGQQVLPVPGGCVIELPDATPPPEPTEPRERSRDAGPPVGDAGTPEPGSVEVTSPGEWPQRAGGGANDEGHGVAVDPKGNVYITGKFEGRASFGPVTLSSKGGADIFVAKLSPAGRWLWVVSAGSPSIDASRAITVEQSGGPCITGYISGAAHFGATVIRTQGGKNTFVACLDSNGSWRWAKSIGSAANSEGLAIAANPQGVLIAGYFNGTARAGNQILKENGAQSAYVAQLNADGNWLWATSAPLSTSIVSSSTLRGVAAGSQGSAYVVGEFKGQMPFANGQTLRSIDDITTVFVGKLNGQGVWMWAQSSSSQFPAEGQAIALDPAEQVYITGFFEKSVGFGKAGLQGHGDKDLFVAQLDAKGGWGWAIQAGAAKGSQGPRFTKGLGLAMATSGLWLTGSITGEASFGNAAVKSTSFNDIFAAQIDAKGNWRGAKVAGGGGSDVGNSIAFDPSRRAAYITGFFYSSARFDEVTLATQGAVNSDLFVWRVTTLLP